MEINELSYRFYRYWKDSNWQELINLIHKDISKKLLSTNNEKWNTIPRTYAEIDTLRAKFEKENHQDKLVILDEINAYVEELEKTYSKV